MKNDIVFIIFFIMAMILFIYNIIKKNHIKLNIILIIWTIILGFMIELGTLPFTASNERIVTTLYFYKIERISEITTFLLLGILTVFSLVCFIYHKKKYKITTNVTCKYVIGIAILLAFFPYKDIIVPMLDVPVMKGLIVNYTEVEILKYKLRAYLKIIPEYILYIQIFILLIVSNFKKVIKEENDGK